MQLEIKDRNGGRVSTAMVFQAYKQRPNARLCVKAHSKDGYGEGIRFNDAYFQTMGGMLFLQSESSKIPNGIRFSNTGYDGSKTSNIYEIKPFVTNREELLDRKNNGEQITNVLPSSNKSMKLTEKIKEIHFTREKLKKMISIYKKGDGFYDLLTEKINENEEITKKIKELRSQLYEQKEILDDYEDYSIEDVENAIKFINTFKIPESF